MASGAIIAGSSPAGSTVFWSCYLKIYKDFLKEVITVLKIIKYYSFWVFVMILLFLFCIAEIILGFVAKDIANQFNNWQSVLLVFVISLLIPFVVCVILEKKRKNIFIKIEEKLSVR